MTGPSRPNILGCILAGGQSRRMGGGDKTLLHLDQKPMLQHAIDRLEPQVHDLILNANGDPARFAEFRRTVISDIVDGFAGPLAGVLSALTHAQQEFPTVTHVATAAGDTPFFPTDYVSRLSTKATENSIVMSRSAGNRHPVFALWPVALRDDLATWMATTETYKVLAWARDHDLQFVDFPFDGQQDSADDPFFNINTPEDMTQAAQHLWEIEQ